MSAAACVMPAAMHREPCGPALAAPEECIVGAGAGNRRASGERAARASDYCRAPGLRALGSSRPQHLRRAGVARGDEGGWGKGCGTSPHGGEVRGGGGAQGAAVAAGAAQDGPQR